MIWWRRLLFGLHLYLAGKCGNYPKTTSSPTRCKSGSEYNMTLFYPSISINSITTSGTRCILSFRFDFLIITAALIATLIEASLDERKFSKICLLLIALWSADEHCFVFDVLFESQCFRLGWYKWSNDYEWANRIVPRFKLVHDNYIFIYRVAYLFTTHGGGVTLSLNVERQAGKLLYQFSYSLWLDPTGNRNQI